MVSSLFLVRILADESRFEAFIDPRCYKKIPDSELPPEFKNRYYERFKLRPPHITAQDQTRMRQKINFLSTKIQFNLASGLSEGKKGNFVVDEGVTHPATAWQSTICFLSCHLLEPLLQPTNQKITAAERILCHFQIAITLLHEFTVSSSTFLVSISEQYSMPCGTICTL
jgi:hypothetical protein